MPAARRYKQSLIDQLIQAIQDLPPGTPPEPCLATHDALSQMQSYIRRKVLEEHVSIATIVDALNAGGFKAKPSEINKMIDQNSKGSAKRASPGKRRAPPVKRNGIRTGRQSGAASGATQGAFMVRPDSDDV